MNNTVRTMDGRLLFIFEECDEQKFKQMFISNFLASYASNIYDSCCSHGQHKRLEALPIEDAVFLANTTWEQIRDEQ